MEIKCVKCKAVEQLGQEDIEYVVNVAKKYTDDVSPNDYTEIFSAIKGKCKDGKKHLYIYSEDFIKRIADIIAEYDNLSKNSIVKEGELSSTLQKIEDLKKEILNLGEKRDNVIKEIGETNVAIDGMMSTFEKETGTRNIQMWS